MSARQLFVLLGVFVTYGNPVPLTAQGRADAELHKAVLDADRRWIEAFYQGDGAAQDALEVHEFALGNPDGSRAYRTTPRSPKATPIVRTRTVEDPVVRVAGDVAVLTGVEVIRFSGEEAARRGSEMRDTFTSVLLRRGGQWRVWSYQATPLTAAGAARTEEFRRRR